ncbi:MAG: universal stress protein [Syntrophobacteraceae bacterium]
MKILLGYDGSHAAKAALDQAKKHALVFKARVYVVTSLVGDAETSTEAIEKAEEELESTKEFLERDGIPVETHLLIRGLSPGEDIVKFAREHQIDEAVVGVKKTSAVGKALFGSNARYVILHAPCPVLTVKRPDSSSL